MKNKAMRKEDLMKLLNEIPDGTIVAVMDNEYGMESVYKCGLKPAYLYTSPEGHEVVEDYLSSFMKGKPVTQVKVFVIE